ncbi:hypothetical protein BGW41_002902 [Actinomortierella wolfii]|nr:hypothetical protein BGW41_002902 [Actinomortierella wolfii]
MVSIKRLKSSMALGGSSGVGANGTSASMGLKQSEGFLEGDCGDAGASLSSDQLPSPQVPQQTPFRARSQSTNFQSTNTSNVSVRSGMGGRGVAGTLSPTSPTGSTWSSIAPPMSPLSVTAASLFPPYKPFILFYRSQSIAQQLCHLEQHFFDRIRWTELLEMDRLKAAAHVNRSQDPNAPIQRRRIVRSSIGVGLTALPAGVYGSDMDKTGLRANDDRSNMLCMWVASEVASTPSLEDRVRVIEKFIRIAQKCHQYHNYNALMQLVMGLGSSHLCGLRRTWNRVSSHEMRVLRELQDFISPCGNWGNIRKAMAQIGRLDSTVGLSAVSGTAGSAASRNLYSRRPSLTPRRPSHASTNGSEVESRTAAAASTSSFSISEPPTSKHLPSQLPLDKSGCVPFTGLFVYDLTHITELPRTLTPSPPSPAPVSTMNLGRGGGTSGRGCSTTSNQYRPVFDERGSRDDLQQKQVKEASPSDSAEGRHGSGEDGGMTHRVPMVHFHRYQLIAKTVKWFLAFQRHTPKYSFPIDSTLYSKCLILRVLSEDRIRELAKRCEAE